MNGRVENYRGATIEPHENNEFIWTHPLYFDVDYVDGRFVAFGQGFGTCIEDCKLEIDEFLEEIGED